MIDPTNAWGQDEEKKNDANMIIGSLMRAETAPDLLNDHGHNAHRASARAINLTKPTPSVCEPHLDGPIRSLPFVRRESQRKKASDCGAGVAGLTLGSALCFGITWGEVKARARARNTTTRTADVQAALERTRERRRLYINSIGDGVARDPQPADGRCIESQQEGGGTIDGVAAGGTPGTPPECFKKYMKAHVTRFTTRWRTGCGKGRAGWKRRFD